MEFVSTTFALSFIAFFILYWIISKHLKIQNLYVLIACYAFYSLVNWKFSFLLLTSSLLAYFIGILLTKDKFLHLRKVLLTASIVYNVGLLFLFKYYNFFAGEFAKIIGIEGDSLFINLIMPVGISFYTFNIIGYIVDVYRGTSKPSNNPVSFLCYISFFPLIMSGPIERSTGLLPQFSHLRVFDYNLVCDGIQQIILGAFKKVVIANNCALVVNNAFGNYENLPASSLVIGSILYSIQIYFDFSGYSDMAVGISKTLGFRVRPNFHFPYFSLNVADFWRRWHMSLQSWFTDYIYIPLGGSRCSKRRTIINTLIVFVICGIWHGANWTFVVWGLYHGLLFVPLILFFTKEFRKRTVNENKRLPYLSDIGFIILTFILITIGWIIFNASSVQHAFGYIMRMFSSTILSAPVGIGLNDFAPIVILLIIMIALEWTQRSKEHALQFSARGWIKVILLYLMVASIVFFNATQSDFIYYQF